MPDVDGHRFMGMLYLGSEDMYIRSVDIPDELVQAHRDGRLVLFVGAGASRDAPANLPDFRGLTRDVLRAAEAHDLLKRLPEDGGQAPFEPLDTLLGRLAERDVDVKRLVAEHLNRPDSQPNDLHLAIVSLARAGQPVRLVTTNYDLHLSTALRAEGIEVEEYRAPALPMGDDFQGVVYLHGSLAQDPRHLVVTDEDFGRAYLRDAWAARFLERMYSTYVVLFVGYSHGDVVMRYLARSLTRADGRYAFTERPARSDWRSLGIVPIGYQLANGSHRQLPEAIAGWATEASRGLLDHRQRVRELVNAAPTGVPEEESYLEATLADADRVQFFVEFARHELWLPWAARRPEFRQLFDARAELEAHSRSLAAWFVDHFVMHEDRTGDALNVVRDAGGRTSIYLWGVLAQAVWRADPRPDWLGPWLVMLVEQAPPGRSDLLEYLLSDLRLPDQQDAALLLFEHLTRPMATVEIGVFGGQSRIDIEVAGSEYGLREAWTKQLVPALPNIASDVLSIADRHLRRAFHLLAAATADSTPFDFISYSRSAIRPHAQDAHPGPIDVLVDAARDSLESAVDADLPIATSYIAVWGPSKVPLLRRLAIHGVSARADLSPTDKLDWLLDRGLLFDDEGQAEVFELLRQIVGELGADEGRRLVAAIDAGGPQLDDELSDLARYERLAWLLEAAPELPGGRERFEEIQSRHPDWRPSSHPDLRFVMETGWRQPKPPMTTEDLHTGLRDRPREVVRDLESYRDAQSLDATTWQDVADLIVGTVRTHPGDGQILLDTATAPVTPVASAVVRGWSRAEFEKETATSVVARILTLDLAQLAGDVADLLAAGGQEEADRTDWVRVPEARRIARQLWEVLGDSEPLPDTDDWLGRAINHPAGKLADFWIRAVSNDWKEAGDTWTGLPTDLRAPIERMLSGDSASTALAEPVIASQLRLLHGADPDWASRHVLPLLHWGDPPRATRAWHGFLYWGRPTPPLLAAGLLDHYLDAASHAGEFGDRLRRQLARHLAGIATSREPAPAEWVRRFTRAGDEELRVEWLHAIGWMMRDLPEDEVTAQWNGWMRQYWKDRLRTIPIALAPTEASAMASWLPHLGPSVAEAVGLLVQRPASLDGDRLLLRDLEKADPLLEEWPGQIATALAHLLQHTTGLFWGCEVLHRIVGRLSPGAGQEALTTIREHALRLGCKGAAEW